MNIPDNYDMWERYEREQEQRLERLPLCRRCNSRIQDDEYYYIDGVILCEDCMKDKYLRRIEDYYE